MAKGNRQSFTSNVTTKIQPLVTTAIHREVLINDLAPSIVFGQDVAIPQSSSISNITVDFTGKDRVDLTRTGGSLNITVTGLDDGETKFLLITKTAGQAVTWVGVTDVTPVKQNANALNLVLYEIVRKSSYYFAKAWVENVKSATETIEGVLETATAAEANALSVTNKIITPGRIPIAGDAQRGLVERATAAECNALTDAERFVTPARIPLATQTQQGIIRVATQAENDAGTAGNLAVISSELKRKFEESTVLTFTGTTNAGLSVITLFGRKSGSILFVTGRINNTEWGQDLYLKTISGYTSPGGIVYFPINAISDTDKSGWGRITEEGDIILQPWRDNITWVFNAVVVF